MANMLLEFKSDIFKMWEMVYSFIMTNMNILPSEVYVGIVAIMVVAQIAKKAVNKVFIIIGIITVIYLIQRWFGA